MKNKLFCLALIMACFVYSSKSNAQSYGDIGIRISKFNQGIVGKFLTLNGNSNIYSGVELFIYHSEIAANGKGCNIFYLKEFNIHQNGHETEMFFLAGLGAHASVFNHGYYKLDKNKQGIYKYPDNSIFNLGGDMLLGFEWQGYDVPISIALTWNPWLDFLNKGPEWNDINFSIKYQFPQHSADDKKQDTRK